ncbi:MAG: alpha,alpha-trehalase [Amphiamblys sp. WSBS2006]|nr:MAG: alpha,alpha-trehalase [Amphiamblys sp. WSBS2006]
MRRKLERSKTVKPLKEEKPLLINVEEVREQLLDAEDTTGTKTITIEDTGPKEVKVQELGFGKTEISGGYQVSNLLQELTVEGEAERRRPIPHSPTDLRRSLTTVPETRRERGERKLGKSQYVLVDPKRINENPLTRLVRKIRTYFWPSLIRTLDRKGLKHSLVDPKSGDEGRYRIYVPHSDTVGWKYFTSISAKEVFGTADKKIDVVRLPKEITPEKAKKLDKKPGLLSLGMGRDARGAIVSFPFAVAGGRFNEMYGWDSYFCLIGYIRQPEMRTLGISVVNNFVYEIENYGKVLNGSRTYYLTRTQPPLFAEMLKIVADSCEKEITSSVSCYLASPIPGGAPQASDIPRPSSFLGWVWRGVRAAIAEYDGVWMRRPRHIEEVGLSRYCDEGIGIPPETEDGHFDSAIAPYARDAGLAVEEYMARYDAGKIENKELDSYFATDRSMRESGHDTTYRFVGVSDSLCTVDLNCLLHRYETGIADLLDRYLGGRINTGKTCWTSATFRAAAEKRKERINTLMWDEKAGMYFDYNFVLKKKHTYLSVTAFWALWAGVASGRQAGRLTESIHLFEHRGGLACGTKESRGVLSKERPARQWDYPIGWAPHQIFAWEGLATYGYRADAGRLAYRWLYMVLKEFVGFNGVIPEKYDVVACTHKVEMEYGNVGTDFEYVAREGFGWVNSSIIVALDFLDSGDRRAVSLLVPPEDRIKRLR